MQRADSSLFSALLTVEIFNQRVICARHLYLITSAAHDAAIARKPLMLLKVTLALGADRVTEGDELFVILITHSHGNGRQKPPNRCQSAVILRCRGKSDAL
jgi:hypothetical protein